MTWETSSAPNETCPKCGAVYKVEITQFPCRVKDRFTCDCGYRMRERNDTRSSYGYTLVTPGRPPTEGQSSV